MTKPCVQYVILGVLIAIAWTIVTLPIILYHLPVSMMVSYLCLVNTIYLMIMLLPRTIQCIVTDLLKEKGDLHLITQWIMLQQ